MNFAQKALQGFYSTELNGPDGLTLEMVLSDTVDYPFRLKDFQEYLKQTYCNENLLFYQAVIDYKEKCHDYFGFKQEEKTVKLLDGINTFDFSLNQINLLSPKETLLFQTLKNRFENILQDFILSDAPLEINLPYEIRHQLLQSYQLKKSYHPTLLYPACHAVIELLRISAFIPFATDQNRLQLYQKKSTFDVGFLKRITTSFKSHSISIISPPPTPTPTISSPPARLSCWKQINTDLSHFKSSVTPSNSNNSCHDNDK